MLPGHIRFSARSLAAVLVLNFLVGCAMGTKEMPLVDPLPVTGPAATVAVLREQQFCGSYPLHYVVLDERPIAALATGEHTSFTVSPGRHTIGVFHHVIDMLPMLGWGPGVVPLGVHFGEYGTSVTEDLEAGATRRFLLRAKCFRVDENEGVMIEPVEQWPDGSVLNPKKFVPPGAGQR